MAGIAQRDCAPCDAGGGSSRSRLGRRDGPVRRHPIGGTVFWGGVEPGQRARPQRDRTRVKAFASLSNGGMIVTASPLALLHRELIVKLAARHEMPAVYNLRSYVTSGGLISYGPDIVDNYR